MPRKRRSDLPDGPFHVIAHAVATEPLFYDDVERRRYLGLLGQAVERFRCKLLTFLLDRHPPRRGHVFERRPTTLPIARDEYLLAVLRYIANNPVRAGICSSPEDYPWSAHRALVGLAPAPRMLAEADVMDWFASDVREARALYQAFVTGADPEEHEAVCRAVEGPPAGRPPLETILVEGSIASIRSAHFEWGYSMRAIASVVGVTPATISNRLKAAR